MTPEQQGRLIENIVGALKSSSKEVQQKMVEHFTRADRAYGEGVAKGLGL
jgi:catalase